MRRARLVAIMALCSVPVAAQRVTIAPQAALVDYGEVSSALRFSGVGPAVEASFTFGRFAAEGAFFSVQMDPTDASAAPEGFKATQIVGRVRFEATSYLGLEVGLTSRTTDSEFAAQSVGAVSLGLRTQYLLGPGAQVWARGAYLAAAQFSGGGSAPMSFEVGLGVDIMLARHVHVTADYSFEKFGRKTEPGGGGEVNAPIEQSQARLGVAAVF
jgi:opacity protein-like surface antigen